MDKLRQFGKNNINNREEGSHIRRWDQLPEDLRTPQGHYYYDILKKKRAYLICKRLMDMMISAVGLILLSPLMLLLSMIIALDSPGGILFRQERVTQYGRAFLIYKFRTMAKSAQGLPLTCGQDPRVTRAGGFLRRYHLDELPQLWNILKGDMGFVGARPEVPQYVKQYTPEMAATLLLPAGLTSRASILFQDEAQLLAGTKDPEAAYLEKILPDKMEWNLLYLEQCGALEDIKIILLTIFRIFRIQPKQNNRRPLKRIKRREAGIPLLRYNPYCKLKQQTHSHHGQQESG